MACIHAQAMNSAIPPSSSRNARQALIERADSFFKDTIVPIEATHLAARRGNSCVELLTRRLQRRTRESSVAAARLKRATLRRQAAEASAGKRAVQHAELIAEAKRMQMRLRHSMRGILSQQEDGRQLISGELRDEIGQALLAIDLSLLALDTSGQVYLKKIKKSIAEAQRILQQFTTRGCFSD
ncbi:MAG: hypothetical protein LC725_01075 [Lentisphaerae bacterium]|nr:hypothetical protein [Lentisphaerota bacterium]